MRFFNTAGPINPDKHYYLEPLERFDLDEILLLIQQEKYFVLHAPRQTGKTTFLQALMTYLNETGTYRCLYVNVEAAQAAREHVAEAMQTILSQMARQATIYLQDSFIETTWKNILTEQGAFDALGGILTQWSLQSTLPLVLLIDEIDSLVGDTLISVLRQLRTGYTQRPRAFPQSIILCGVRDVRDYRMHTDDGKAVITGGSAFNIKAESLRLGGFDQHDIVALLSQHTQATGQPFADGVFDLVWYLTAGQPWLVNALAYEVCFKTKTNRDRSVVITTDMIMHAKESIILRRETHLDQLIDKLKEDRVRRVISPMLQGTDLDHLVRQDDVQYVVDLGLVHRTSAGPQIANAIYREIIPRELSFITQLNLESQIQPAWYIAPDGTLDMHKFLQAFQHFFREHSEHWVERFDYKEAGPQLLLQAFLQRIVNSDGQVQREYGLGRKRTDLLIIWPHSGGTQRVVLELKLLYNSLEQTLAEGLPQTWDYMDRCGANEGHLIIFDRTLDKPWEEKIFTRVENYEDTTITVWGM